MTNLHRIQFEYKGRSSTLKSVEDIAAWIEERKKRFPTKERIAQRQKEERKRTREQAQAEKKLKLQPQEKSTKKRKRKDGDEQDKAIRKAEKLREKLRMAEEAVAKAKEKQDSQSIGEAAPKKSLGINYDSDETAEQSSDDESGSLVASSSEISIDSDSDDSSSSSDGSGDDAPPEEESSAKRPLKVHLPNRKAPPVETTRPRPDRHKQEPKRMTLRERVSLLCSYPQNCSVDTHTDKQMLEQQRRQEAELVLQAIKFLGQNGILG